jgi:hypothetical protein
MCPKRDFFQQLDVMVSGISLCAIATISSKDQLENKRVDEVISIS